MSRRPMTDTTAARRPKRARRATASGLVQVAPDSEVPETRSKRSGGRGLVIGLGLGAAFWAGVAVAVMALRS